MPWKLVRGSYIDNVYGANGALVVHAEAGTGDMQLIAAAPEMYEELHTVSDWLATVADEMDCTAGNFDGGSAASCEHCQWKQSLARIDALLLRAGGESSGEELP